MLRAEIVPGISRFLTVVPLLRNSKSLLKPGCRSRWPAPRATAVPESVYNCAIARDPGISALKSTTSSVAFISADLNSDINLTKLNVSILGHKQHNFQFLDRQFVLSVNEQHFILWRSGLKLFTYV